MRVAAIYDVHGNLPALEAVLADVDRAGAEVEPGVIVCGHTHRQFDRAIGRHRVINAGSVGLPFEGRPEGFARRLEFSLLDPAEPDEVAEYFDQRPAGPAG